MDPDVVNFFGVMMTLLVTASGAFLTFTIITGLRRRIAVKDQPPAITPEELDDLRARLDDAEHLQDRIAELEQRLDFAERMLTRPGEEPRLSAGS